VIAIPSCLAVSSLAQLFPYLNRRKNVPDPKSILTKADFSCGESWRSVAFRHRFTFLGHFPGGHPVDNTDFVCRRLPTGSFSDALGRARAGSVEAAAMLVGCYADHLRAVADAKLPRDLRSKVGGSDAFLEAWFKAATEFEQFLGHTEGEFLAWLQSILDNVVIDFIRSFRSRKRITARERCLVGREGRQAFVVRDASSPAMELEQKGRDVVFRMAMAGLSKRHQLVLRLHNHKQMPFREVGSHMGISEDAARYCYTRALVALGKRLTRLGFVDN
jgi:RNA polymerase sigma-70 factor (ECF subfamily)